MQSIGISFSISARSTPACAMPRAAPPDSASAMRGRLDGSDGVCISSLGMNFLIQSTTLLCRIQQHYLRSPAGGIQKVIYVRPDFAFGQRLLNLFADLFKRFNYTTRVAALETRHINIAVIVGNIFLCDDNKAAETKIQILVDSYSLLENFVELIAGQTHAAHALLEFGPRRKLFDQAVSGGPDLIFSLGNGR